MRHQAVPVLRACSLADPQLRFVAHGENTSFRVNATAQEGRDRFCCACTARHVTAVTSTQPPRSAPNLTG